MSQGETADTAVETNSKTEKRTLYCSKCLTRYTSGESDCVTCKVPLESEQPREGSIFKPKIDIPFLAFAAVFLGFHARLPGEAQSFGMILLVVGFAALVAFRAIGYAEWLGRR